MYNPSLKNLETSSPKSLSQIGKLSMIQKEYKEIGILNELNFGYRRLRNGCTVLQTVIAIEKYFN